MTTERPFDPVASVSLLYVRNGHTKPLHVAVEEPHRPAQTEGAEEMCGCRVVIDKYEDAAIEVLGADELEALELAIRYVRLFLQDLAKDAELRRIDGSPFNPEGSPLLRDFKNLAVKLANNPLGK